MFKNTRIKSSKFLTSLNLVEVQEQVRSEFKNKYLVSNGIFFILRVIYLLFHLHSLHKKT